MILLATLEIRDVIDELTVNFVRSFWLIVEKLTTKGGTMGGRGCSLDFLKLGSKISQFYLLVNQILLQFEKIIFKGIEIGPRIGF